MITPKDITTFYTRYDKNKERAESLNTEVMQADTQESLMEKLSVKAQTMRHIYIENEAMLNLYIRPYLEDRQELKDETALAFAHAIYQSWKNGLQDEVSMILVGEKIAPYLYEHHFMDAYILVVSTLGVLYNNCLEEEEGEKGFQCFKKICDLSNLYFGIEDFEVRKRIIYAFYNRAILQVNFRLESVETLYQNVQEGIQFFTNPDVLALDGDKIDFSGLTQEMVFDVYENYVTAHSRQDSAKWFLEDGEKILSEYYQQELQKNPNPYEMPDEIFCAYKRICFFLGKSSCTEFIDALEKYCAYNVEHSSLEHEDGFWDSRLFHVVINQIPNLLECYKQYSSEYYGNPIQFKKWVKVYLDIMKQVPCIGLSRFVIDEIVDSFQSLVNCLDGEDVSFDSLLDMMLNRDKVTLMHSRMVLQIALFLLDEVLEKSPSLLRGALDCEDDIAILENRDLFISYLAHASKLFDIGKLKDVDIIHTQYRQLTEKEYQRIYQHTRVGANLVEKSAYLSAFKDIVLGHHKSWDGTMGYPASFDNTKSKNRFLIELIHMSDSIAAATDFIGRNYRVPKSFAMCLEELKQGKDTLYCGALVDLIESSPSLQRKLQEFVNQGRMHTYCEVYSIHMESHEAALPLTDDGLFQTYVDNFPLQNREEETLIRMLHNSSEANYRFLHALIRHSLLTMQVNLRSGTYQVFTRGQQRLFDNISKGLYEDFLHDYLQSIAFAEDWVKLQYQLQLSEVLHTLVMQHGSFSCELRLMLSGEYHWTQMQFFNLDERDRIPNHMAIIFTDTEKRHAQSEKMEVALKTAYQAAIEASKAKSVFLSHISHDMRTPMNGILGMTDIALRNIDNKDRVIDCLEKIRSSSEFLKKLINEVLDVSSIESGKLVLNEEATDMRSLLQSVIDACLPSMLDAKQKLFVNMEVLDGVCAKVDAVRLQQIFTNIVYNAIKYTPEDGSISIDVRKLSENAKESCYQFTIRDTGIGMSEEFQKHLFEPFAREDNTMVNKVQGNGLGLSIVKPILSMMSGTIEVESVLGKGTTFIITLPLHLVKNKQEDMQKEIVHFEGERVLLVEDNALNREIACEMLKECGLAVEIAHDGKEAVDRVLESPAGYYAFVLMDIQMPKMNGYEATRAIRHLGDMSKSQIPIIALSANALDEDVAKALESGMNDHLMKPIDIYQLYATLKKWLVKKEDE